MMTETDLKANMFSSPSSKSDLVLMVEEKKLHVNKSVLSYASPVFERMFEGEFKEKSQTEIPLPDKSYDDMLQLLLCVFPTKDDHPITRENLDAVLPLADEYGMESIKQRCEKFILNRFLLKEKQFQNPNNKELVHFLYLSDKYRLACSLEACIEKAKLRDFEGSYGLKIIEEFSLISYETKFNILSKRMALLEMPAKAINAACVTTKIVDTFESAMRDCPVFYHETVKRKYCSECMSQSKWYFKTLQESVAELKPCFTSIR